MKRIILFLTHACTGPIYLYYIFYNIYFDYEKCKNRGMAIIYTLSRPF